jgi:hypothetical protein
MHRSDLAVLFDKRSSSGKMWRDADLATARLFFTTYIRNSEDIRAEARAIEGPTEVIHEDDPPQTI